MEGQMSLFDFASDEQKKDFEITLPDVGEFPKEELLVFEKEVLGIYVSGHPLEEYEEKWRKNISAVTSDFLMDEETGKTKVQDGDTVIVGGMISTKTIKYTKTNKVMAFVTLEDLVGTVEIIIFPRDYDKYNALLEEDAKIFVRGHANVEEEKNGKLICESITAFSDTKKELWLKFETLDSYEKNQVKIFESIRTSDGKDPVIIFISATKQMKKLPINMTVNADKGLESKLAEFLGENNVKVVEKSIENNRKKV